jgi:hypothetical protein
MTESAADTAASADSWIPEFLIESFAKKKNAVRRWQDGI